MQENLVIRYYERKLNHEIEILGEEVYFNIDEAFIPDMISESNKRFLYKKFLNIDCYQWLVIDLVHPPLPHECNKKSIYNIILDRYCVKYPEVYLTETLKKSRANLSRILYKFTLVEVDFGFTHSISKYQTFSKTPKRYPNILQLKEMRKRRLAIVLQTFTNNLVQIVPLTSKEPKLSKYKFKLSDKSLEPFTFYGSGKESWALCDMIQTVSITRINPGVTRFEEASGYVKIQRNEKYPYRLVAEDRDQLSQMLLDCYSPDDYLELKKTRQKYFDIRKEYQSLEEKVAEITKELERYKAMSEAYELDLEKEGF